MHYHHHGAPLCAHGAKLGVHHLAVFCIQVSGGLVQQRNGRGLRQQKRKKGKLALAARKAAHAALRHALQPGAPQGKAHLFALALRQAAAVAKIGLAAHGHQLFHGDGRLWQRLRHHGQQPCARIGRKALRGLPVQQDGARAVVTCTRNAARQRGFSAAVFAKQSRYLPRPGRQAGALQNGFFAVGEAHVFTFNHSCGSF